MPVTTAFDLGPLSWVKGEIDAALERAGEALRQFGGNAGDVTQARLCRNHLHQVRGALTIVGLDGVTQFTDALEALLADLESGKQSPDAQNLSLVSRALQSVRHYLDNLVAGEPNQPLRLFDLYRQIATARGESAPSASDLFFPDLGIRPALPPAPAAPAAEELVAKLKTARSRFQKGMLGWLKNSSDVASINECRAAAAAVGTCNPAPVLRAFWWTVSGLFAALAQRSIPLEAEIKPLLARIDQQIRQQIEGSRTVPERLMRDALFYVAIARSQLPEVQAIRAAYALDSLIPTDNKPTSQTAQLEPLIRRLREIARTAEENWSRFCGGNTTAIGPTHEAATQLAKGAEQIGLTDFKRLTQALVTITKWVAEDKSRHNDSVAMETATAILLLANTLDNFAHLGADFVHQVDVMVARLHGCIGGKPPSDEAEIPMLDEMTRLAQEKLLIAQVVREIQSNLGQIEQALDTFFRDPDQRDQLKACHRPVAQVAGALTVLGQSDAVAALTHASERIAAFAAPGYKPRAADFESVANQLSALGFFVEALRSGNPDYTSFIRQLGQRSKAPSPASGEGFARNEEEAAATARLPLPEVAVPEPPRLEMPVPDEDSVPESPALDAVEAPAGSAEPATPPSRAPAVTAPPAAAPTPEDAEIDAELLDIFLEEANEVLGMIAENLDLLKAQPSNNDALTTMRRAFHTLKGSSRMVGLRDFGEVAWVVEQVHNLWLRQERAPDMAFFKLVQLSHEVFSAWVKHLESGEGGLPDPLPLVQMGEAMKGGETVTLAQKPAAAADSHPPASASGGMPESSAAENIELGELVETGDSELTLDLAPVPEQALELTASVGDEGLTISFDSAPGEESADAIELVESTEALVAPELFEEVSPEPETASATESIEIGLSDLQFEADSPVEPPVVSERPAFAVPDTGLSIDLPILDGVSDEAAEGPAGAETATVSPTEEAMTLEFDRPEATPAIGVREEESVPVLFQIFLEEARGHLATLLRAFGEIELDPTMPAPPDMIRSAHTLGSIGGTVGFDVVKALGHGLESALLRRSHIRKPTNLEALEVIREVIAELEEMVVAIAAGKTPEDRPLLVAAVGQIYAEAEPAENAEADLLAATSVILPDSEGGAGGAAPELPADELDESLLPIFIEEAGDLVGAVNERLAMWRSKPDDVNTIHALARLLHTLKGSARMAGALGIGALTHTLETMVEAAHHRGSADPEEIARFQVEFDNIADRIASLSPVAGADTGLPRLEPARGADQVAAPEMPGIEAIEISAPPDEPLAPLELTPEPAPPDAQGPTLIAPPPAARPAAPGVPLPADSLDEDLLPVFLEESTELVKTIYAQLNAWRAAPTDAAAQHALARALHTLKGSARMAGAMSIGALTHTLEARVEELTKSGEATEGSIVDVQSGFDTIAGVIERLQQGEALSEITVEAPGEQSPASPPTPTAAPASAVTPSPAEPVSATVTPIAPIPPEVTGETGGAVAPSAGAPIGPQKAQGEGIARPMLRVRAELIDRLVNDAGELSIARARIEGEMRGLKQAMLDLTENVIRLRRQLREIEIQAETQLQSRIALASEAQTSFDPLELDRFTRFQELTRMMAESVNDVATVQQSLLKSLDESNAALANQGRLNRELQQALMSVRMVPFAGIVERLYRITRQTAKEIGKRADLEVHGSQIELDQNIINKMIGPLEHLLRNAVSHGIEMPERRVAAGKVDIGEITLTLRQEGNEVIITMEDDGAGLDLDRIREKAIAKGLIKATQKIDPRELTDFIFHSGFSTATKVTQVSGRGVGMDVVRAEVGDLGGRIEVQSEAGKGATFRIYLPLTLAVTNAALIRIGSRTFAIPASMIDQVMEVKENVLADMRSAGKVSWQGAEYPFHFLPHLLGDPGALPEARKFYWVLLLHSGAQRVAVQVDELTGSQEIVVKNIGPQLARVVGIAGATVLGDGRVLLILNPVALAARPPVIGPKVAAPVATEAEAAPAVHLPTVLVVDDSLTVRKITSRLLAREGYQVVTAKDGVDALQQMTEFVPDVILSDIEMPRMDGFELARNIRGDERLREIPIVMITSRTAEKHRSHATELGVDHFLGKPYQEEELLRLVGEYTAHKRASV
jgi:chemosensory pili system protein ChpA (sensor histidine kinase/response regulator)